MEATALDIIQANQRHDREHPSFAQASSVWTPQSGRIGSAWKPQALVRRGKLTDKRIAKYAKDGWYSPEFKEARRSLMDKKRARAQVRDGNFVRGLDGAMVYSPL